MTRTVKEITSFQTSDGHKWDRKQDAEDHQFELDERELEAVFERLVDIVKGDAPEVNRATAAVIVKNLMLSREAWDFFGGLRFNRDDVYAFLEEKVRSEQ